MLDYSLKVHVKRPGMKPSLMNSFRECYFNLYQVKIFPHLSVRIWETTTKKRVKKSFSPVKRTRGEAADDLRGSNYLFLRICETEVIIEQ